LAAWYSDKKIAMIGRWGMHPLYPLDLLSQIVYRMCQWKNFENRSIFGKDHEQWQSGAFL